MNKYSEIVKNEACPMYVFDLDVLKDRIAYLRSKLPEKIQLCYAIKANAFIVEKASELTERIEICSPGEYRICNALGLPSEKFVISGVNKDEAFIEELISSEKNIGIYTVESKKHFEMLSKYAQKYSRQIKVLLRLTSGNQFGMDENDLEEVLAQCKGNEYIAVSGIQYFSGTQKTSCKKLKRELTYLDEYMSSLREKFSLEFEELEFGPGLPASYFEGDKFDEDSFLDEFSAIIEELNFKGNIIFELGRSIAASCGTYFTSVVDTKCNKGENYAIVDGGMHQIVYYGQFMAMKHPNTELYPRRSGEEKLWNICGSLCTANDILVKQIPFADLKTGDVIAFKNTGAYCVIEGISLFLSRDLPKVILAEGDAYKIVRDRAEMYKFNLIQEN